MRESAFDYYLPCFGESEDDARPHKMHSPVKTFTAKDAAADIAELRASNGDDAPDTVAVFDPKADAWTFWATRVEAVPFGYADPISVAPADSPRCGLPFGFDGNCVKPKRHVGHCSLSVTTDFVRIKRCP